MESLAVGLAVRLPRGGKWVRLAKIAHTTLGNAHGGTLKAPFPKARFAAVPAPRVKGERPGERGA